MSLSNWVLSEDSFLRVCCRVHEFEWGTVYDWPEAIENPKLHFVRVTKPHLDAKELREITDHWRPYFESRGLTYCLKASDALEFSDDALRHLAIWEPSLNFLRTSVRSTQIQRTELKLVTVQNEEDFMEWWLLFSTLPTREEKIRSPFFRYAKRYFEAGTKFYLLQSDSEYVAGLALDVFRDASGQQAVNLWGVCTRESWQRRGIYKEFEARVLAPLGSEFYLQVIEGSALDQYYRISGSGKLLARQRRYRWTDSPT